MKYEITIVASVVIIIKFVTHAHRMVTPKCESEARIVSRQGRCS